MGYFFKKFYWSIVDSQCCFSFRYIAKWINYTYTSICSLFRFFSYIGHYRAWLEFPVEIGYFHRYMCASMFGEGNGNPLQYSCLENPRDGGAWWAAVYGVAQSRTRLKRLSSSSRSIMLRHQGCGAIWYLECGG